MTGAYYLLAAASIPLAFLLGFVPMGVWVWRLSGQMEQTRVLFDHIVERARELRQERDAEVERLRAEIALGDAMANEIIMTAVGTATKALEAEVERLQKIEALRAHTTIRPPACARRSNANIGYPCESCDRLLPEPSVTMLCEDCEAKS